MPNLKYYKRSTLHKGTCLLIGGTVLCGDAVVAVAPNTQAGILAKSQVRQGTLVECSEIDYTTYQKLLSDRTKDANNKKKGGSTTPVPSAKAAPAEVDSTEEESDEDK